MTQEFRGRGHRGICCKIGWRGQWKKFSRDHGFLFCRQAECIALYAHSSVLDSIMAVTACCTPTGRLSSASDKPNLITTCVSVGGCAVMRGRKAEKRELAFSWHNIAKGNCSVIFFRLSLHVRFCQRWKKSNSSCLLYAAPQNKIFLPTESTENTCTYVQ